MENIIEYIVNNWDKIPDKYKTTLGSGGITGATLEEHIVVILLDRQKPSVQADYSFDEERISITRTGKIIWGFDSGCSCPSPWHDNYPGCYSCGSYKEFEVQIKDFDENWLEECKTNLEEIKKSIE